MRPDTQPNLYTHDRNVVKLSTPTRSPAVSRSYVKDDVKSMRSSSSLALHLQYINYACLKSTVSWLHDGVRQATKEVVCDDCKVFVRDAITDSQMDWSVQTYGHLGIVQSRH